MIMAHQRSAQITSPNVLDALANCAIRMANSDDEAKYLADKLRTTTDFIRSLPRGTFATFIRDVTPTALALKIPYTDVSTLPQMTAAEQQAIRERMRAQFSFSPQKPDAPLPQVLPTAPPLPAAPTFPETHKPAEPECVSDTTPLARTEEKSDPTRPAQQPTAPPTISKPAADPHTGTHTEPASKWGDD